VRDDEVWFYSAPPQVVWQKLLNATRALPYYLRLDAAQASAHPPSLSRTKVITAANTRAEQHTQALWAPVCSRHARGRRRAAAGAAGHSQRAERGAGAGPDAAPEHLPRGAVQPHAAAVRSRAPAPHVPSARMPPPGPVQSVRSIQRAYSDRSCGELSCSACSDMVQVPQLWHMAKVR
jgi:hypothetical protein